MSTAKVAVCTVTFRRPDGLRRLLDAINGLTFSARPAPEITLVVVDNDAERPMEPLIAAFRRDCRWPVIYGCEPVAGVSSARNHALRLVPADSDFIAFIDDDEVPEPQWLDELLATAGRFGVDMVQGPVRPVFEREPAGWMTAGRFYEIGPFEDGAPVRSLGAGNCLIRAAVPRSLGLTFDMRFNHIGGEDEDFFGRALRAGHRAAASGRAVVHETVPASRMRVGWLVRRWFRMGNTLAAIDSLRRPYPARALRVAKGGARIALGLFQLAAMPVTGTAGAVRGLCNISWGAGSLAGLMNLLHHEYDPARAAKRTIPAAR